MLGTGLLADVLNRQKLPTMIVDRGSILLIVYAAFSAGVVNGIWSKISAGALLVTVALGFLVGQVMKATRGQADAATVAPAVGGAEPALEVDAPGVVGRCHRGERLVHRQRPAAALARLAQTCWNATT